MTPKSICILGRLPAIGRAELESILLAGHTRPVGDIAVAADLAAADVPFSRLGGSTRLGKVLAVLGTTKWADLAAASGAILAAELGTLPEGKLKLGLSAFGVRADARALLRAGLELKKVCKQSGRSVRIVPNTDPALSSAQVLHNQLAGDLGIELLFVQDGNKTIVARTVAVQNITAYAARDQHRPKRDARVGMLPPKLAQTIVNLATGPLEPAVDQIVLDPFCGTGVVLQEAALMGYGIYGTDLEPRMIDYTRANLDWLARTHIVVAPTLEVGDATTHQWQPGVHAVACETYLGRPLSGWPADGKLREIITTCNTIIEKFMRNIAAQIPTGTRLCLAVPAWQDAKGHLHHLQLLDHLDDLGYNRVSFEHVDGVQLVYSRPEQFVARELLVITRK
jgi:SAM-dependent methyltransferase